MNQKIVAAVVIITGSGVMNAWMNKKPITRVVIGSYILLLVLSVMDMFGGGLSQLASGIAILAATYVLLTEFPWNQVIAIAQGKAA